MRFFAKPLPVRPSHVMTTDLPVLTHSMIEAWKSAGHALLSTRVRLGGSPEILGPDAIGAHDVRVWRRDLSPEVKSFAEQAMVIGGHHVKQRLLTFFRANNLVTFTDGALHNCKAWQGMAMIDRAQKRRLSSDDIVTALSGLGISGEATQHFAHYVVTSLEAVLTQTPLNLVLLERVIHDYDPGSGQGAHSDRVPTFLMHFTDPGTPYPDDLAANVSLHGPTWRVQAGDINWHGGDARHYFASSPQRGGTNAPRLALSFSAIGNIDYLP